MKITSLQNPRVKEAARLRDRRQREKQQRILIDGTRELTLALAGGVRLREAFVCEPLCHSPESRLLLEKLPASGAEILEVTEPVFAKLAFGDRAEGVLGVADMPKRELDDLVLPASRKGDSPRREGGQSPFPDAPLVAVLECVEKPGNVGAVLRSADGAGLSALIVADARTDLYNPNAIRASLGTIFTLPVCAVPAAEVLGWLRRHGIQILAALVEGSSPYTEVDYRAPTAIVLGSEAEGLSSHWRGDDIRAIRLPMLGTADSLNVSAAAAVLFYEARRQRDIKGRS